MFNLLFRPPLHGAAGPWDEIVYGLGFVLSVFIFVLLAFSDRRSGAKPDRSDEANKEMETNHEDMDA